MKTGVFKTERTHSIRTYYVQPLILMGMMCLLVFTGCSDELDLSDDVPAPQKASTTLSIPPAPTMPNGTNAALTEKEMEKYHAGKYVEATEKHPAYNVPKPVYPENTIKSRGHDGIEALINYRGANNQYLDISGQGDGSPMEGVYTPEWEEKIKEDVQSELDQEKSGDTWHYNSSTLRKYGLWIQEHKVDTAIDKSSYREIDKNTVQVTVSFTSYGYTLQGNPQPSGEQRVFPKSVAPSEHTDLYTLKYIDGKGWRIHQSQQLEFRKLS